MSNTFKNMDNIANLLSNMKLDADSISEQEVDIERVEWYKSRFDMLISDGVPDAIHSYLKLLLSDDVNELTRTVVLHEALSRQLKK